MSIIDQFPGIVGRRPPCEYQLLAGLANGSFATVFQMAQLTTTPPRLVVGKFMDTGPMPEKNKLFAEAEVHNASKCVHPNIIEFVASFHNDPYLLLVFEFADAGDLSQQISMRSAAKPPRRFREDEVIVIVTQICLALNYLHQQNIMHRDLKTANVFLTTYGLIKLGDFGLSRQYDKDVFQSGVGNTFVGTPYYVAPELWRQTQYSSKADMWSVGVIMYELMALRRPFTGDDMKDLVASIESGVYEPISPEWGFSAEVIGLMDALLNVNASLRPSVVDVLRHPRIQSGMAQMELSAPRLPMGEDRKNAFLSEIQRIREFLVVKPSSPS